MHESLVISVEYLISLTSWSSMRSSLGSWLQQIQYKILVLQHVSHILNLIWSFAYRNIKAKKITALFNWSKYNKTSNKTVHCQYVTAGSQFETTTRIKWIKHIFEIVMKIYKIFIILKFRSVLLFLSIFDMTEVHKWF